VVVGEKVIAMNKTIIGSVLPQVHSTNAYYLKDCDDDPKDAQAHVPAVQPFGGSDLLTIGAHAGTSTATSRGEGYFLGRSVHAAGIFGWRTASLLLHVARALELDRFFAGVVHLRD